MLQGCIAHCTQRENLTLVVLLHLEWAIDEKGETEKKKKKKEDSSRVGKIPTKLTKEQKEACA